MIDGVHEKRPAQILAREPGNERQHLGGTGQRANVVRADRDDLAIAHRQGLRRRRVIDDDLAVKQDGVGELSLRRRYADQQTEQRTRRGPYNRCKVHSVSMNMSFAPGGVRRYTLVCL